MKTTESQNFFPSSFQENIGIAKRCAELFSFCHTAEYSQKYWEPSPLPSRNTHTWEALAAGLGECEEGMFQGWAEELVRGYLLDATWHLLRNTEWMTAVACEGNSEDRKKITFAKKENKCERLMLKMRVQKWTVTSVVCYRDLAPRWAQGDWCILTVLHLPAGTVVM